MHFAPDTIVVDDRGYNDYRLFAKWTEAGVYFVTRLKDNAQFGVVEEHAVPQNRHIITDQTMAGMTGMQLSREIMRIRPGIPVILCTYLVVYLFRFCTRLDRLPNFVIIDS